MPFLHTFCSVLLLLLHVHYLSLSHVSACFSLSPCLFSISLTLSLSFCFSLSVCLLPLSLSPLYLLLFALLSLSLPYPSLFLSLFFPLPCFPFLLQFLSLPQWVSCKNDFIVRIINDNQYNPLLCSTSVLSLSVTKVKLCGDCGHNSQPCIVS